MKRFDIFGHFEFHDFAEKFEKQHFSWVFFCIKFGTLIELNALYRMTPKSFKLDIAWKVTPKVKNESQILTMGLTLKVIFNWNDFVVIR